MRDETGFFSLSHLNLGLFRKVLGNVTLALGSRSRGFMITVRDSTLNMVKGGRNLSTNASARSLGDGRPGVVEEEWEREGVECGGGVLNRVALRGL